MNTLLDSVAACKQAMDLQESINCLSQMEELRWKKIQYDEDRFLN